MSGKSCLQMLPAQRNHEHVTTLRTAISSSALPPATLHWGHTGAVTLPAATGRKTMIVLVLPDLPTEDALLARACQGDREAITEIYDQYFEAIYQFIRLRVENDALAEDLAGDVFLKLLAAFQGGSAPRHSLRGWLFRVARNVLHDHYGQEKQFATTVLDEWVPAQADSDPEAHFAALVDSQQIRLALRALPVDQQEVLILRFGQMLSLADTAAIMGRSTGAIKSLQFRAASNLHKALAAIRQGD